jgi:hypothetical protein
MNLIKFLPHRTKGGLYYNVEKLDGFLDDLAYFFTDEIGGSTGSSWVNFLISHEDVKMSGNQIDLEKNDNNVYIDNLYNEGSQNKNKKIKITISNLIKLIKTWENLMEKEANEITLEYKNRKFELFGKYFIGKKQPVVRMAHESDDPKSWFKQGNSLINTLIEEAYEYAYNNDMKILFLESKQEYMVCGYTNKGLRIQMIFDKNNNLQYIFCPRLKKEKIQ